MDTVKVRGHTDSEGILRLELPVGLVDADVEVTLTINPTEQKVMNQDEWRAFLEETAGILADDPIERGPQGQYEEREKAN